MPTERLSRPETSEEDQYHRRLMVLGFKPNGRVVFTMFSSKTEGKNIKGEKDTVHIKRNQKRELKIFIKTLKISSLPQSHSLVISGGGLSGGDGGGGGGGKASSTSGARASANRDRRMQLAEWLVLDLLNPDLRENTLLKLSKVYSSHFNGLLSCFA
ncbi:hypothetical protein BC332_34285 [Capsicum chinense]|nr:hypothetical protein BC332_34285 [Capsicum chinense]